MSTTEPAPRDSERDAAAAERHAALGGRLREARERQGIGVRELSRRVSVSPSLISQVELGKASPSVGTLYAIVNELGLSLDELFSEQSTGISVATTAPGAAVMEPPLQAAQPQARPSGDASGLVVRSGDRQGINLGSGVHWERLTPVAEHDVDFLFVTYDVGGASCPPDQLMRHSGKEYGYVTHGMLGVTVGFETHQLAPGDAITFTSTMPHRLFAIGDEPATAVWFVVGRRGDPRSDGVGP